MDLERIGHRQEVPYGEDGASRRARAGGRDSVGCAAPARAAVRGVFQGTDRSDAFGSAYEGIYRLPADATGIRPKGIYKFFACLDDRVRRCPEPGCIKQHLLDTLIIHLNDDHHWSRERIAAYIDGEGQGVTK